MLMDIFAEGSFGGGGLLGGDEWCVINKGRTEPLVQSPLVDATIRIGCVDFGFKDPL